MSVIKYLTNQEKKEKKYMKQNIVLIIVRTTIISRISITNIIKIVGSGKVCKC